MGLGLAVIFVLGITLPVNYLLENYVLKEGALAWLSPSLASLDLSYLAFILFIAVIAAMTQLVEMAVEKGRSVRPDLKCGICGEHGGEPSSVKFCHKVGLNYVSCSPFRVPIARLAAAQAAIEE